MSKLLIGLSARSGKFGVIPDPPEPQSDRWYESHCPKCKHYREWEDGGKIYGECTNGICEFEENEDGTD